MTDDERVKLLFPHLPLEWRNRYMQTLALGIPKIASALLLRSVNRVGAGFELTNGSVSPW